MLSTAPKEFFNNDEGKCSTTPMRWTSSFNSSFIQDTRGGVASGGYISHAIYIVNTDEHLQRLDTIAKTFICKVDGDQTYFIRKYNKIAPSE